MQNVLNNIELTQMAFQLDNHGNAFIETLTNYELRQLYKYLKDKYEITEHQHLSMMPIDESSYPYEIVKSNRQYEWWLERSAILKSLRISISFIEDFFKDKNQPSTPLKNPKPIETDYIYECLSHPRYDYYSKQINENEFEILKLDNSKKYKIFNPYLFMVFWVKGDDRTEPYKNNFIKWYDNAYNAFADEYLESDKKTLSINLVAQYRVWKETLKENLFHITYENIYKLGEYSGYLSAYYDYLEKFPIEYIKLIIDLPFDLSSLLQTIKSKTPIEGLNYFISQTNDNKAKQIVSTIVERIKIINIEPVKDYAEGRIKKNELPNYSIQMIKVFYKRFLKDFYTILHEENYIQLIENEIQDLENKCTELDNRYNNPKQIKDRASEEGEQNRNQYYETNGYKEFLSKVVGLYSDKQLIATDDNYNKTDDKRPNVYIIALIHFCEPDKEGITENNASRIAADYGYVSKYSGRGLLDDYIKYTYRHERKEGLNIENKNSRLKKLRKAEQYLTNDGKIKLNELIEEVNSIKNRK
ncbi:MAG: hypothetical protein WCK82_02135 [Bacteroidota bacterium]